MDDLRKDTDAFLLIFHIGYLLQKDDSNQRNCAGSNSVNIKSQIQPEEYYASVFTDSCFFTSGSAKAYTIYIA